MGTGVLCRLADHEVGEAINDGEVWLSPFGVQSRNGPIKSMKIDSKGAVDLVALVAVHEVSGKYGSSESVSIAPWPFRATRWLIQL